MSAALFRSALVKALAAADASTAPAQIDASAANLAAHYAEPIRAYHNAAHIAAMLAGFEEVRASALAPHAIVLAVLFHDAIYDPRRSGNEAASAAYARTELAALGAAPATIARIADLILATQHGIREPAPADTDCALLLDLDLAILGSAPDAYRAYAAAIRREYAHVPDALYRPGRARVLKVFLDQPHIYRTPVFRAHLEAQARLNLAAEIAQLEAAS